ncbi:MAG: metallophosphoesterase family protein [Thermoleophilaceae bacterium]|nr:metallophosphoesterase family protein [Thermoleophilaceae bacterium]
MRTLLISDLHLGAASHADILRRPAARAALAEALKDADRLVLLGDALELREGPVARALEEAGPALATIREAMAGRAVVWVPGNHDHAVVEEQLELRRFEPGADRLGLEQVWDAGEAPLPRELARHLDGVQLSFAYPGLWIREDVYATHGHYLDLHSTMPTFESLAAAVSARLAGGLPEGPRSPADYEAALAPLYAFSYKLAQADTRPGAPEGPGVSARLWASLNSRNGERSRVKSLAAAGTAGVLFPAAVGALNRAGLGRFKADISLEELTRTGAHSMASVVRALGIDAEHVLFGHTHRVGPHGDSDPDWPAGGPRLWNTGSWVWSPAFVGDRGTRSPYWPGHALVVEDEGPPFHLTASRGARDGYRLV